MKKNKNYKRFKKKVDKTQFVLKDVYRMCYICIINLGKSYLPFSHIYSIDKVPSDLEEVMAFPLEFDGKKVILQHGSHSVEVDAKPGDHIGFSIFDVSGSSLSLKNHPEYNGIEGIEHIMRANETTRLGGQFKAFMREE